MPSSINSSGIRDNHRRGNVADFLKARVQTGSRLSVVSAGRDFVILNQQEQARETADFELVTWLVIKAP